MKNRLRFGFTMAELVVAMMVASFLVTLVTGGAFTLYYNFMRSEERAENLTALAEAGGALSQVALNTDTFLRHPADDYTFTENECVLYREGRVVSLAYADDSFIIKDGTCDTVIRGVTDCEFRYLSEEGYETGEGEFPALVVLSLDVEGSSLEMSFAP